MIIRHDPNFVTTLWKIGFISNKEFDKYMKSEKYYHPKMDGPAINKQKADKKPNTLYVLKPIEFSYDVRDFIESHAEVEYNDHFKLYTINNTNYIEFNGK